MVPTILRTKLPQMTSSTVALTVIATQAPTMSSGTRTLELSATRENPCKILGKNTPGCVPTSPPWACPTTMLMLMTEVPLHLAPFCGSYTTSSVCVSDLPQKMPGQTSSPCLHNGIIRIVFVWSALQHLLHAPFVPDPIVHCSQSIPRTSLVERPLEVIFNLSPVLLLVDAGEHDEELHFLGIWISSFSRILVFSWRLFQVIASAVVW